MRRKSKKAISYSRRRSGRTEKARTVDAERIGNDNLSWINDEVDKFNSDRNEVDLKVYDSDESSRSEEEVLPIRLSSDDEEVSHEELGNGVDEEDGLTSEGDEDEGSTGIEVDSEEGEDEERRNEESGSSDAAIDSDIVDSDYDDLPDANAWGQKRSAFYSADYVGDEHAGFGSSDEEPAELEEKEALNLQRSLNEWISGVHDEFPTLQMWEDTRKGKKAEDGSKKQDAVFHVPVDLSAMSSDQKLQILEQRSPELVNLIEEYKEHAELMERYVPFCQMVEKRVGKSAIVEFARAIFEIIGSYLLNVGFYILMKAKQCDMENHPVIDRIAQWKEVLNEAYSKWPNFEQDISSLMEAVQAVKPVPEPWASFLHISPAVHRAKTKGILKRRHSSEELPEQVDDELDEVAEMAKRSITYEMKKNKGLMPKRKKEQRNPRVKHRNRYRKALKKLRSQRPDVKTEVHRYSGESRGINPFIVRSIKLR
uniref:Sas10 domain-containing protein n=1 Tax=Trichuris muris TaxID=70415 RepID=A0A5S6QPG1_TRIMR